MSPASLTYAILAERFRQQDQNRERAALVDAMQARRMRPEFRKVFDRFAEWNVAIVGSSVRDFDNAHDIDLLFPADTDFRQLARELGLRYLGKFPSPLTGGDVRRLSNTTVEGVGKPIQCISDSSVTTFEQWPHTVLLRDGRMLNADQHYTKPAADAA
jgi:hypothetical protein